MCGLAGWVGYDRDLTRHADTVSAMAGTLECRGPDDHGTWVSRHAALGHRRLSVIDLAGGRQPMHVTGADDGLPVIVYTGEVYNYRELRRELAGLGHTFRTTSDTEVVLHAYLEWGQEFAERLNGMYALAVWDPRGEELLLVRDRMGVKPLFYYPTRDGVLFGSEAKAILAHPEARAAVDREGLAEIFAIINTPGHAVFKGMHEVVPGTVVRFTRGGRTTRTYWELRARPHTDDLDTTVARVRELLEDIVERQLVADVKVGTLLSGGLDSSAITALAAKALRDQGAEERIKAFSVDFRDNERDFRGNGIWLDPDTPYAVEVARHCGAEHIVVELENNDVLDEDVRRRVLLAQDLPISTGDMEHSLYHLCRALKERVTVALSGETSDELFGGYNWFFDREAVEGDTFPWYDAWRRLGGLAAIREIGLWDRLGMEEYVKQRYAEALAEVPRLAGESGTEARMRELSYLNISRWEKFLLDRKDRISMATGLEVRVPFTDHRLVEYVFNVPWEMKNFDGREKSLLRAATAHVLPESVLRRRKSPYPSTQDQGYVRALRDKVAALLRTDSPVLELVPAAGLRALLDKPLESYAGLGGLWGTRAVMERLVEYDAWVREYGVRVED
ncbi:asparagine synthase (glutamine-hydrolyzing) [Streptomyces sp. TRM 70361]|uniref:asparagine synthase (glutamine-hydrolyzing) n=1 Tax=Streptomyces sp. TRM 70361 TaxID=3116553 RepID=UPI002E7B52FE|nr:asparagine synthase (glutamine-hydrolyzing) [Streptomyces sp. TRM 70361]MEE1940141.1 asparagine synthase (glutamine-hydrolyzing) [Streptomyces sp. TRM 70361]